MNFRTIVAFVAASLVVGSGCATTLPKFGASADANTPYQGLASYYGYIAPGAQPDETRQNKPVHYLYLWLPSDVPELAVRVISPTKGLPQADGQLFRDPNYSANADTEAFFDPWIMLERCPTVTNVNEAAKTCPSWTRLGENDDTNELPDQPSGRKTNALLRVSSAGGDQALSRGLYRIAISDAKKGQVQGSYLLQLGTPGNLSGLSIAPEPDQLR